MESEPRLMHLANDSSDTDMLLLLDSENCDGRQLNSVRIYPARLGIPHLAREKRISSTAGWIGMMGVGQSGSPCALGSGAVPCREGEVTGQTGHMS